MKAIGIDVGGHGVKAGIVSLGADSVEHVLELPYDVVRQNRAVEKREVPRAPRVETALDATERLLSIDPGIQYIGIATTGVVDPARGIVTDDWAADYVGTNWKAELRKKFGNLHRYYVENDAKAAAWGEYKLWAKIEGKVPQSLVQVIVGSGIGAGIIINGHVLSGHKHVAGEFGSLPYFTIKLQQREHATIETYSASPGLLRESGCPSLPDLAARVKRGELKAKQALEEGSRALGLGVAALVNIIGPEVLLFGGGTVELLPDYVEMAKDHARKWSEQEAYLGISFALARLGNMAGVVGIAHLAMEFGDHANEF